MTTVLPTGIKRTLNQTENANLLTEIEAFEKKVKVLETELKSQTEIEESVEKLYNERKKHATAKLETSMRYNLTAPPNLLYHDDIITSFLFCPICVSDGHGEFSSQEEARAHVQLNKRHAEIIRHGGKKYLDMIKCTRCRVCGLDIFGGDQVLSHLMSDRHRLNSVGNWDANTPTMLNMTLDKIEIDELQPQLNEYCQKLNASAVREASLAKLQTSFVKTNASKYATTNFGGASKSGEWSSQVNGGSGPRTPFTPLKLNKTQKKKGATAIMDLWKGPSLKNFAINHCGMNDEQFTSLLGKFTVPFIYQTLDSGKSCFVCKYEFPLGKPLSDAEKVTHVMSQQHKSRIGVWTNKIDSLMTFEVPFQMKSLLFMYCPLCEGHLGNWNSVVAHLEVSHPD